MKNQAADGIRAVVDTHMESLTLERVSGPDASRH
jgi:hypothetical protein